MKKKAKQKVRLDVPMSNRVIDGLGGNAAVSELCEVSSQAVSQWRTEGIPKPRLMFLRERFKDLPLMQEKPIKDF